MKEESVQFLKKVLAVNFEALGFTLVNLEHLPKAFGLDYTEYDDLIRGTVRCPCGAFECFNSIIASTYFDTEQGIYDYADMALRMVANKHHLEDDIKNGTLPPFDVDKHVFKELVRVAA